MPERQKLWMKRVGSQHFSFGQEVNHMQMSNTVEFKWASGLYALAKGSTLRATKRTPLSAPPYVARIERAG